MELYESWNGEHVFVFSNKAVSTGDIMIAKAARNYDPAAMRRMCHVWMAFAVASFAVSMTMIYLSLREAAPDGTITADAGLLLLISLIPLLNGVFAFVMRSGVERNIRNIEAYLASSFEERGFDIVDDSRPFWRGVVNSAPEWGAMTLEMRHRTALGSELTGMLCREWSRCPQTFAAAPQSSSRFDELEARGEHFGLRMLAKHLLHYKLLHKQLEKQNA